jgi:hypothetical protein
MCALACPTACPTVHGQCIPACNHTLWTEATCHYRNLVAEAGLQVTYIQIFLSFLGS